MSDPWKHDFGQTNGIRMHYVTAGDGPLVVLLHGFPEFWYSWRRQIPALASRFRVVAPDLRGYNDTERPAAVEAYRLSELAADVADLIRVLGYERAAVVGHDWGGAVAYGTAAWYPEATERLVVMNCPHPTIFQAHMLSGNLRQMQRSWYMFFFQLPHMPEALLSANDFALLQKMTYSTAVRNGVFTPDDVKAYVEALAKPGALTAAINYYRNLFRPESTVAWPLIAAPTLLIWGEEDPYLGRELTEGMEPYFSQPPVRQYIPGCGHWVQQEASQTVTNFLLNFL